MEVGGIEGDITGGLGRGGVGRLEEIFWDVIIVGEVDGGGIEDEF